MLTKEDIKTLKKGIKEGRTFVFHHEGSRDNGNGTIRMIKRKYDYETDKVIENVDSIGVNSIINDFTHFTDPNKTENMHKEYQCSDLIYDNDIISTIVDILKTNDIITLKWIRSNNNELLTRADLHKDELHVEVLRKNKNNTKKMKFIVSVNVYKDNTARMIKITDQVVC